MLLVSQLVIVGLVQSSVVLIHYGASAHTLDWYEDDDLEGVRFSYKIQEDLAQDGQPIQYAPFTSSRWHAPNDISSQSSALPPGGTQVGVALPPAFTVVQEPTVSRSESVSSSSTVSNNLNRGLGVTFEEFPSFNSISKYDNKEDKNSFHTIHKSVTSSSPTMSVSIVRRVGSYEHAPINLFGNFGISRSVSTSNNLGFINAPAPVTSIFSRKLEVKPFDVQELDDDSAEKHILSINQEPLRNIEEKAISTPVRSKFVPTLALLRSVTVPRPVNNLRYQFIQQLSSTEDFTSSVASSTQAPLLATYKPTQAPLLATYKPTQAPLLATYKPIFKVENDAEEVKSTNIQVKASDDDNESSEEKTPRTFTRSKQPGIESKFAAFDLKRQSKPLSRFRYQHVLALSREDD